MRQGESLDMCELGEFFPYRAQRAGSRTRAREEHALHFEAGTVKADGDAFGRNAKPAFDQEAMNLLGLGSVALPKSKCSRDAAWAGRRCSIRGTSAVQITNNAVRPMAGT